jgi:hypothetical protein
MEFENELPENFILDQNFPNPFNPTTTIRFLIPERSLVTLKIYDILGNEVLTLINKYMEVGSYEVKFNANKYSSGIYLYKISAGDFISTKKMILIK